MRLDDADLRRRLEAARLDALSAADLRARFVADADVAANAPAGQQARDPRDGTVILYNEVRARRPHDNRPAEAAARAERPCAICAGQTTGIVDVAPLGEGFTFINKNLYPALFPHAAAADGVASGLHFLQWSSTVHEHDWHNLPQADRVTLLRRLAALERVLLQDGAAEAGAAPWPDGRPLRGYLGIFKNYGYLVGGSLAHGHQQMVYSPALPPALARDWAFRQAHGESVAQHALRETPAALRVRDYGAAVLLVPAWMRRPYHLLLIVKEPAAALLADLDDAALAALADGWRDATVAIRRLLPAIGREVAYNVLVHNGPGGGLYVEFLPYSQELGGMEHLGLWICHGTPETAVAEIKAVLG